jgi:hypothetical protein
MSKHWVFDVGDSTSGPVGFVASVEADTPEEAADTVNDWLPEMFALHSSKQGLNYLNVYFNDMAVTAEDAKLEDETEEE